MVKTGGLPEGSLCRVEWVKPASPFTYPSTVELLGFVSYSPPVKSVFPLSFSFPLSYACSLPACPEESTSLWSVWGGCDPRAVHLIFLSFHPLFLSPLTSSSPPPLFMCQQRSQLSTTNHSHTQTQVRFTNRPAWHAGEKMAKTPEGPADCFGKNPSGGKK